MVTAAHGLSIQFMNVIPETCGNGNGRVDAMVTGGVWPYSYLWSNGGTTESITGVSSGTYTLTVTDNVGTVVSDDVFVPNLPNLPWADGGSYAIPDGLGGETWGGACAGQCNGMIGFPWEIWGGSPPYSVNWNAASAITGLFMTPEGMVVYEGFCLDDEVTFTYSDTYGCPGSGAFTVIGVDSVPSIEAVHGACNGGANGRVDIYCPQMPWLPPSLEIHRDGNAVAWPPYPNWPAQTVIQVQGLIAGDYELHMVWDGACPAVVPFTIPALTVDCGTVSGTTFLDDDQDCEPDAGEVRIPFQVLNIQPVDEWVLTGTDGEFLFAMPNGAYTLAHSSPNIVPLCPLPQPVPFTVNSDASVIQLADSSTLPLDLEMYAAGSIARPGFISYHHLTVYNRSAKVSGTAQVVLTFDPVLGYLSATPAPALVSGNTITWDLAPFSAFQERSFAVQYTVPVATALGTVLNSNASVSCTLTDADLSNNTDAITQTVTGSYDPNDKTARTSSGWSDALYYIDQDEWIDYAIRFQNTGTDTAFTVVITDTIAAELDMSSFEQGTASHAYAVAFKPGRVVEWTFADILLPDSNVNEPASHGLVSFRMKPAMPLVPGTTIENIANIYFDFNEPVITESSVLVAEFSTGVELREGGRVSLAPVPASDELIVSSGMAIGLVRVLSTDGREVMQLNARTTHARINLNGLISGVYLVDAELEDGTTAHERFIKQ